MVEKKATALLLEVLEVELVVTQAQLVLQEQLAKVTLGLLENFHLTAAVEVVAVVQEAQHLSDSVVLDYLLLLAALQHSTLVVVVVGVAVLTPQLPLVEAAAVERADKPTLQDKLLLAAMATLQVEQTLVEVEVLPVQAIMTQDGLAVLE